MQLENDLSDFDLAVDAANQDVAEIENEEPSNDAETLDEVADDGDESLDDVAKELKVVQKALDKRNRYLANKRKEIIEQRAQIESLQAELQKLRSELGQKSAPKMEDFESVIDFIEANQTHKLDQKLSENALSQREQMIEQQKQMILAKQAEAIAEQYQEYAQTNPDFGKTIQANAQIIQSMPPHIEALMADINNAPAATYALVKDGILQSLYNMPPHLAAAYIAQAEVRGLQLLRQSTPKQSAPAPKPIGSVKGAGKTSTKSLDSMNPDELIKWLND